MSTNNTFSSEVSQRYALALYDLSTEKNQTEEFSTNMINFMKMFNSNENLKNFVKNPTHSAEEQKLVFNKILNHMNFNQIVKNFFLILIEKKKNIFFRSNYRRILKINFKKTWGSIRKFNFF